MVSSSNFGAGWWMGRMVDSLSDYVEQTAFDLFARRNGNRMSKVFNSNTALQTVGTLHRYTSDGVFTDVLFHFEYQGRTVRAVDLERSVNGRNSVVLAFEGDVDNGADHLCYCSEFIAHRVYISERLYRFCYFL